MDCIKNILEGDHHALDVKEDVHDRYKRRDRRREPSHGVGRLHGELVVQERERAGRAELPFPLLEFWKRTRQVDDNDYELV